MVIWDDLRIDLWQPHIGHAGSAKDNPIHAVVVFTRILSPNWNHLLCLRLQETTEESFTHWISYLYTLNTIKHHRMMKTTHTVTVLSKPFCTTMHAFSWTLPHYLLPWQGAGDAADTSIGAGPGPSPVRTDGAGCGLALATKEWWLYGVNMCKCYFQWFVYFFSYLEQAFQTVQGGWGAKSFVCACTQSKSWGKVECLIARYLLHLSTLYLEVWCME